MKFDFYNPQFTQAKIDLAHAVVGLRNRKECEGTKDLQADVVIDEIDWQYNRKWRHMSGPFLQERIFFKLLKLVWLEAKVG